MATHQMHHYIPDFLLRQWQSAPDGKLTQFTWVAGKTSLKLEQKRYKGKAVAKQFQLNSMERFTETPDNSMEVNYFTSIIDNPAAVIHRHISELGVQNLDDEQRKVWVRFLAAQMIRIPSGMDEVRALGKSLTLSALLNSSGKEMADAASVLPTLEDAGIKALPYTVESLSNIFLRAKWDIITFNKSNVDLIIADSPFVLNGFLSKEFFYSLPITPRVMFVVYTDEVLWEMMSNYIIYKQTDLAKIFNRDSVEQAYKYIYATNSRHEPLIRKYLRRRY